MPLPVENVRPLEGKTIALLRARGQGGELARGLEDLGATLIEVPMIAVAPAADPGPLARAVQDLASYAWVAVTSPNAAEAFVGAIEAAGLEPAAALGPTRLASVGPGTTARLAEAGLPVALEAKDSHQEGLAAALAAAGVSGSRVLFPRSDRAREALPRLLEAAGARVDGVEAYRTLPGNGDPGALLAAQAAARLDAVCFTSASTARNLAAALGATGLARLFPRGGARARRPLAASLGPIASAALRELGLEPDLEAAEHSASGLVRALQRALC